MAVIDRERRKKQTLYDQQLIRALRKIFPTKHPMKLNAFVMRLTRNERLAMLNSERVRPYLRMTKREKVVSAEMAKLIKAGIVKPFN